MYVLNEKVRAVLSLAFQNFHTIFEELNNIHNQFQVNFQTFKYLSKVFVFLFDKTELDRELKLLIDMLTVEIKSDANKLINIEEETLIKMKACFQEMVWQISIENI